MLPNHRTICFRFFGQLGLNYKKKLNITCLPVSWEHFLFFGLIANLVYIFVFWSNLVHPKENIKADEVVVHVDFSENYDNKQQHATQSAYFGYQQFSIYTVDIYHKEGIEKMAIITPDKDHSHVATYHLNNSIPQKSNLLV